MIEYVQMSIPKKYIYCVMSVYIGTENSYTFDYSK